MQTQNDDVIDDDKRSHHDNIVTASSTHHRKPSSNCSPSSTSTTSSTSSRVVSASSSDDLFDESRHENCEGTADVNALNAAADASKDVATDSAMSGTQASSHGCRGLSDRDAIQMTNSVGPVSSASNRQTSTTSQQHGYSSRPGPPIRSNSAAAATAAHVTTFQITPTLRQRAFPRTNPAYIGGTYRRDRPPAYRRMDSQPASTSVGVASELRPSPGGVLNSASRRPNSDGIHRTLIQHTGDVVLLSNAGSRRAGGRQCTTVVPHHQRLNEWCSEGAAVIRLQSEGGPGEAASAVRATECRSLSSDTTGLQCDMMMAAGSVIRRQSEPDYVNVMTRHQHPHPHPHQQQQHHMQPVAGLRYYGDECSEWTPSAIYMNQHELTIAGRYTSRSTCNFMDPTANGNNSSRSDYLSILPGQLSLPSLRVGK